VGTKPMFLIFPSKPIDMMTANSTALRVSYGVSDEGLDEGLNGRLDHVFGPLQENKKH
jgi:hypothetical protein